MAVSLDKVQRSRDAATGALYLHADHLGSVDAVTNEAGLVEERRSYDAFGQGRNPVWGATPGGSKPVRYVDVAATDASGNIVELHQVGRQTQSGQPVARELQALDDIEKATGIRPIFHPYNGP